MSQSRDTQSNPISEQEREDAMGFIALLAFLGFCISFGVIVGIALESEDGGVAGFFLALCAGILLSRSD